MARNKGNRGRGRGGGYGGNPNNNTNTRGGYSDGGRGILKHGCGRHNKHNNHRHHHQNSSQPWSWHRGQHHGDADSVTTNYDSDTTDYDFIDPSHFPPAESNAFSNLLRNSMIAAGTPECLRSECKRAKKNLGWIQTRDKRLSRALKRGLEHLGTEMVEFLLGGSDDDNRFDDADVMDWMPEPTVNLIMMSPPKPEPPSPPQAGLGVSSSVSLPQQNPHSYYPPQLSQQQQQPAMNGAGGPGCGHNPSSTIQ